MYIEYRMRFRPFFSSNKMFDEINKIQKSFSLLMFSTLYKQNFDT